ncbi:MAG: YegP family protein [Victivallales bacterium]|nr:YegP family protein [Victivallales bacterium]
MGKFQVKAAGKDGLMFNLLATNGQVIATSEVYNSKASLKNGIESVQKNAPVAPIEDQTKEGFATEKNPKFEVYQDKSEKFRFRLKAKNGEIIAVSQAYASLKTALEGIASVKKNAPEAPIVEE